jgi:hypothetical protein
MPSSRIGEASVQDDPPATMTPGNSLGKTKPAEPTLLGIPRELRNKIFKLVNDTSPDKHVLLIIYPK